MSADNVDITKEKDGGGKDRPAIDDSAYRALEMDFDETVRELMGDQSLDKFRAEFEKLRSALHKSHDSERRLILKCQELRAEIVANSAKVSTATKLSQNDQSTIASLRKEIDKAWKMVDAAHEQEIKAKDTIEGLKQEISQLSKMVEDGTGFTLGQDSSMTELVKLKEELVEERDGLMKEVTTLRDQVSEAQKRDDELSAQQDQAKSKIQELQNEILKCNNDSKVEERRRAKLDAELRQVKAELEVKNNDLKSLTSQLETATAEYARAEKDIKELKVNEERQSKETETMEKRLDKLQKDFNKQLELCDDLNTTNQAKALELKQKEEEMNMIKLEIQKIGKVKDGVQRRLKVIEEQKIELEQQKELIKAQMNNMEKEIEASKKQAETEKKQIEELTRERDLMSKNVIKAAAQTQKQTNLVKLHEQSKVNLEQEIINYREEAMKQRKIIYQLEKERDKYINEASDLTQKVLQQMEEVKVREMKIFDYKKKIAEAETKLKQQQNLYEAVRSDRNLYSKNLIESQDEITEMKRKLKIMNHQIEQLKEEISSKEAALVKEHAEYQRIEREKDGLKAELRQLALQAEDSRAHIKTQEQEHQKLLKIISAAEAERARQKKELDQVVSERDILGTQLVRRNDELGLLYEKIKIQQSTLNKGEEQFNSRVEDIRVLKLEIKRLRRERGIVQRSVANVEDLKREVYHLQREMLKERTRAKALEEELENPLNVHRWRKLEGNDPSTYEMIQKMQALQKRLIAKTEEVVEKELDIQEKEKLYMELKRILSRQPGPEVAEQLRMCQSSLKDKNRQMKSMTSELNMYESQVSEYKYDIERLNRDLQDVKKKYFMQKKKEQRLKERERLTGGSDTSSLLLRATLQQQHQQQQQQQRFTESSSLKEISST